MASSKVECNYIGGKPDEVEEIIGHLPVNVELHPNPDQKNSSDGANGFGYKLLK